MPKRRRTITGNLERIRRREVQRQRRFSENDEAAATRRAIDGERHREERALETPDEIAIRRSEDVQRHRVLRAAETEAEVNVRRIVDAEHHRATRAEETIQVHEDRLVRRRNRHTHATLHNVGRSTVTADVDQHSCSSMNNVCFHCNGLFFAEEKNTRGRYIFCCHEGKIVEPERNYPQVLRDLFTRHSEFSGSFFQDIRSYNSALSFASMGASVDVSPGSGPYCFRIHGAIYHKTSNLRPLQPGQEKYAQLYILDADEALRQRLNIIQNVTLNEQLLMDLDAAIRDVNPYAQAFKMLKEFEEDTMQEEGVESASHIRMYIKTENLTALEHRGRYNAPKQNEVAVVFKSADGAPPSNRDIVVHPRGGGLINIPALNPNLDPMSYVLFFPFGEKGFTVGQGYTELQFYSHRVSVRQDCFNAILYGRKLFQQYLVDSYVKVEGNRLAYLRTHQKNLRVETYMGLADHVYRLAQESGVRAGIPVILPSSFIGSPRCMQQNYQDSMAIVRDFGKPDLFVTFTCNPKWPEIIDNLFEGQKAHDRPDIVSRVFNLKKKALLEDLTKKHVLGVTIAHIHVIEFQKRGLPHMHLLLILAEEDKVRDADCTDTLVCAELPDANADLLLHDIVKSSMIHGPCGVLNLNSPCMKDGVCSKGFPKPFQEETKLNVGGYPLYRRRDNGNFIMIKNNVIDNRWVVPYNPYLTKKYNAHINVEVCSSIKSVKYLFKYVYKGHDAANVILEQAGNQTLVWDEIKNFLNARYVSAPEAIWRLFKKEMHSKSHSIIRLPVHLENMQPVYFEDSEERQALEAAAQRKTMLIGWFDLNRTSPEACAYLYVEIPKYFVWRDNAWHRRQRLGDCVIPRMYSVSPKDVERFHLRMLLCHVKGATSYQDVKSFRNVIYGTFKEACRARNLLQDDEEWKNCMQEASTFQMPSQLRQLFAFICVFGQCTEPIDLWNEFKYVLSEDFARSYSVEDSHSLALRSLEEHLRVHSVSLTSLQLPEPAVHVEDVTSMQAYDARFEMQQAEHFKVLLNAKQTVIYNVVLHAVEAVNPDIPKLFCVNAFAGAGKTFLFKTLLHAVRGMGHIAVPVAWTGIAAVLMKGGRTAHSTFKLPIPLLENSTCRIRHDSPEGIYLKTARLFIWDECTMTPHHALEAVDRLLRDLTGLDVPFGGKTVILGGDWRQILPVVPHGNRISAIENCLRNSMLWTFFRQFTLNENMRLTPDEREFSEWLLKLGDGRLTNDSGIQGDIIEIPPPSLAQGSIVDEIFGSGTFYMEELASKAILCPKNDETLKLNEDILARFPGQNFTFYSADSIHCEDAEEEDTFQMDFVHSLTPSGMPPHRLNLKVGAVVMLLRNLNPTKGLCNGTRLIVKNIMQNILDCEVLTGQTAGSRVFIPRIQLSPSDSDLPFELKRRQFPIRLAFAMTINKSQGQTFKKVGIFLPQPVFSHGMLYVAFSRCTSMANIRVSVTDTRKQGHLIRNSNKVFTENVVYREVLHTMLQ